MIRYLSPYANILVATRQKNPKTDLKCRFVDDVEALSQEIVIPSIPAQFLESYISQHANNVRPGTLVVDVCSVKVKPVEILKRLLPPEIQILATHPMFGPSSAAESLAGQRIMLAPVRIDPQHYQQIKTFLGDTLGLQVIETTPEEHDRVMAYVQGLSHYIGRVMDIMKIPNTALLTSAYEDLLDMKKIQGGDSWELFESIMLHNPYARSVHDEFRQACQQLDAKLKLNP